MWYQVLVLLYSIQFGKALTCYDCLPSNINDCIEHYNGSFTTEVDFDNELYEIMSAGNLADIKHLMSEELSCYEVLFKSESKNINNTVAARMIGSTNIGSKSGCEWFTSLMVVDLMDVEKCSSCTEDFCNKGP